MATGSVVKHQHDCTVVVTDGAMLSYTPSLFDGSVSIGNLVRKQRDASRYEVRGQLKGVRHVGRVYPTVTLTFQAANYSGSVTVDGATETASPADVFTRAGTWSAATSTLPVNLGGGDVYCVDVQVRLEGTDLGDSSDHTVTLNSARPTNITFNAAEPATWVVELEVLEGITGDISILEG